MRSLKAYWLPRLWPSTMCASSCESTSGQAGFVGQDVDQAAADDDRVADAEGFQRRRDQHAGADRTRQFDVVGDLQVVDNGLEDFVEFAFGSEQSGAFQAFENVVFRLLLPFALRGQRRSILRGGRIVFHAVHANLVSSSLAVPRDAGCIPTCRVWALKAILFLAPAVKSPSSL